MPVSPCARSGPLPQTCQLGRAHDPPPSITASSMMALAGLILHGSNPERSGISSYTREDIAHLIRQRFGKRYHPASLSKVLRRMGFSRQKARQVHPKANLKAVLEDH